MCNKICIFHYYYYYISISTKWPQLSIFSSTKWQQCHHYSILAVRAKRKRSWIPVWRDREKTQWPFFPGIVGLDAFLRRVARASVEIGTLESSCFWTPADFSVPLFLFSLLLSTVSSPPILSQIRFHRRKIRVVPREWSSRANAPHGYRERNL